MFIDRPASGVAADAYSPTASRWLCRCGPPTSEQPAPHRRHRRYTDAQRLRGVRGTKAASRPKPHPLDMTSSAEAQAATDSLLGLVEPPTALGCCPRLARAERQRRARLVGFDDFEFADLLRPSVTGTAHDATAMGRMATELLLAPINGDDTVPSQHTLPVRLLARTRARASLSADRCTASRFPPLGRLDSSAGMVERCTSNRQDRSGLRDSFMETMALRRANAGSAHSGRRISGAARVTQLVSGRR
ncbi:substrate-binding domain-containing protein [Nocardia iowensis]|uniref:substrate-binding domain-containing protein n=1 Tax=Nocardia iowensis TaxID=204891 RepID=UPI003C2DAC58